MSQVSIVYGLIADGVWVDSRQHRLKCRVWDSFFFI